MERAQQRATEIKSRLKKSAMEPGCSRRASADNEAAQRSMAVRHRSDQEGRFATHAAGRDRGVRVDDIRHVDHADAMGAVGAVKDEGLEGASSPAFGVHV